MLGPFTASCIGSPSKGGKQRTVYVKGGAAQARADWLMMPGSDLGSLFLPIRRGGHIEHRQMTSQAVYNTLQKRVAQAGVDYFSPHDLRRTFVGDLLDNGADISTVSKLTGHANIETTRRYNRRSEMVQGLHAEQLFRLLNPICHSDTREKADLYQVEPFVIAADIYSESPHIGRGGWTWYTGSSGWMYRLGIEAILGLHCEGSDLRIEPRISRNWPHFEIDYRYETSTYLIRVENPNGSESGVGSLSLDGIPLQGNIIPLVSDDTEHHVVVVLK